MRDIVGAGILSMLVLGACLLALPERLAQNTSSDYWGFYRPAAENLVAGHGLVDRLDQPALRYPPGYPLVLAATFALGERLALTREAAETALNLTLWSAGSIAVFLLTLAHWDRRGAWLATLAWTGYPLALWMAKQSNSELLFTPLLVVTLIWFWRMVRAGSASYLGLFLLGVLTGATMLVRPAAVGLGFLLAVSWGRAVYRRSMVRRTAAGVFLVLLGNAVTVAPWQSWMHRSSGKIYLLGSGTVTSVFDGLTFGVHSKGYREDTWIPDSTMDVMQAIEARASAEQVTLGILGTQLSTWDLLRIASGQVRERPAGMAGLVLLKAARSWYGTDSQRLEGVILLLQLVFLTPAFAALAICLRGPPERRQLALVTVALVLYFWAMSILALSIVRYMVPVYALLVATLPALFPTNRTRAPSAASEAG